jgi:nitrogen fixation NifU-like protein
MDELYREALLEHYRTPSNKGKMLKPTITKEDSNPLCGDTIEISLRIKDDKIQDVKFVGKGCVVSMASADILASELKGKTTTHAQNMTREELLDLIGLNLTHTRIKCAMLSLITIKKAIIDYESTNKNQKIKKITKPKKTKK